MENQAVGAGCGNIGESWRQGQTSHEAVAGGLLLTSPEKIQEVAPWPSVHGSEPAQPSVSNACVICPSKAASTHHQIHQAQAPNFELLPGLTLPISTRPAGTSSSLRPLQSAKDAESHHIFSSSTWLHHRDKG